MDLTQHPDLAERLAAAYGLGTLRGGARRRFEAQARQSPRLRGLAIAWQERFAAMTELQPEEAPSPNVWKRIQLQLDRERDVNAGALASSRARPWRGLAWAGALASVVSIGIALATSLQLDRQRDAVARLDQERASLSQRNLQLVSQLQASPDIRYVAMLSDERSAPAVLITFDPKHNTLTLKRVGGFDEGAQKSLQLWALPPGGAPQSLGVLPQGASAKLTAAEGQVRGVPALAISLEPKGGVAGDRGPTGPVLFKGALVPTS